MPEVTTTLMDDLTSRVFRMAQKNVTRDGYLAEVLFGVTGAGIAVTFMAGPPDSEPTVVPGATFETRVLPGALSANFETIAAHLEDNAISAAIHVGEFWAFPEGDAEAPLEYMAGSGTSPSGHPQRQEGMIVSGWWPLGGYTSIQSRRLVRAGKHVKVSKWVSPSLNAYRETDQSSDPGFLGMVSSWVEECLPSRGQ